MSRRRIALHVAVGLALALLASLSVVVPRIRLLDPASRARHRWWTVNLQDGARHVDVLTLFEDARGRPIDRGHVCDQRLGEPCLGEGKRIAEPSVVATAPPFDRDLYLPSDAVTKRAGYRSRADVPPDPWGRPWYLVIDFYSRPEGDFRCRPDVAVFSAGPDGRFALGLGDDIRVDPGSYAIGEATRPHGVPRDFERGWRDLAVLLALSWMTVIGFAAPRSPRLAAELAWSTLAAALPGAVAFVVMTDIFRRDVAGFAQPWLAVRPETAVGLTLAGAIWAAVFWWRHRKVVAT